MGYIDKKLFYKCDSEKCGLRLKIPIIAATNNLNNLRLLMHFTSNSWEEKKS